MTRKEKDGIYKLVDFLQRMEPYCKERSEICTREEGRDNYWAIVYDWESKILGYIKKNYITKEMWKAYYERRNAQ